MSVTAIKRALDEDTAAREEYKQKFRLGSTMHQLALLLADQDIGFEFSTKDVSGERGDTIAKCLHRMAEHEYINNVGRGKWRVV